MKTFGRAGTLLLLALILAPPLPVEAAKGRIVRWLGRETSERIARRGGREATERTAREATRKGARQGGQAAVEQGGRRGADALGDQAGRQGAGLLNSSALQQGGRIAARNLDNVSPAMRQSAEAVIRREGDRALPLIQQYGDNAVMVMNRHPGTGADLLAKLGSDAVPLARALPEQDLVRLMRHMDQVSNLPAGAKRSTLDAMARSPARVADFLEQHPRVLKTGAGVTLAAGGLVVVNNRLSQAQDDLQKVAGETRQAFFPDVDLETGAPIHWGKWIVTRFLIACGAILMGLKLIKEFFAYRKFRFNLKNPRKIHDNVNA